MTKLSPVDIAILASENSSRQMNIAFVEIFQIPARRQKNFVSRVLKAYRSSKVAPPFNQKLKWNRGVPSLESVETDLRYHVRHIAVPPPGDMEKFYEMLSFLNSPALDHARPLWECYLIEGLEDDKVAILHRIHHVLTDGVGVVNLFEKSRSTSARDMSITPLWSPFEEVETEKKRQRSDRRRLGQLISAVGNLPSTFSHVSADLATISGYGGGKKQRPAQLPLGATKTIFNNLPTSSERRYANCQIALAGVKAIASKTGTTINDVLMTVVDHGLHKYLKESNAEIGSPLVALMPISVRLATDDGAGNQIAAELVKLGDPDAPILQRLMQVNESTLSAKKRSGELSSIGRQLYSLAVMGSGILLNISDAMKSMPSHNLVISNVVGSQKQFYLAGAPLIAMHGLPVVAPGSGLNVTFASLNNAIELGIGVAPEAVDDPCRLTQLFLGGFAQLEKVAKTKGKAGPKKL